MNNRANSPYLRAVSAVLAMGAAVFSLCSRSIADDGFHDPSSDEARIRRGYEIAPVPLNLKGKDWRLVGLGSHFVNAVADCNGCHTADPSVEYAPGGNPYFKGNQPKVINQSTYLAGGHTFAEFLQILRTGEDLDHLHPNCTATLLTNCFPFNGDLVQIMPWPVFQSLKEQDIRAIYEYLSAIPCIEGPASGELHNDCV
ncbi:MAG: cytochrome C [Steroidobacteraceae bacterium]